MAEHKAIGIDPKTGLYVLEQPAADQILDPAQIKAMYGVDVPVPMSQAQLDKHLGTKTAAANASTAAQAATAGPGGFANAFGDQKGDPFLNKDGKPFVVADAKRKEKIDNINAATQNVRRMADLVKIIRAYEGGASEARGSKEYQELVSLASATDFETYKAFGLGAPSATDASMATEARGGKDITSFIYDPAFGFEAYAKNLEGKLTTEMRAAGYNGKPIELTSIDPAKAVDRSKAESGKVITQGIAPDIRANPEELAKEVQRKADEVKLTVKHKKPSVGELRGWAQDIDAQVKSGELTKEQAIAIVTPMAVRLIADEKRRIESDEFSVEKLKKLQDDPAFRSRLNIIQLSKDGKARPEEIYRLIVEGL